MEHGKKALLGIMTILLTFAYASPVLAQHWGPPLGAVAGFMLGLLGTVLTG